MTLVLKKQGIVVHILLLPFSNDNKVTPITKVTISLDLGRTKLLIDFIRWVIESNIPRQMLTNTKYEKNNVFATNEDCLFAYCNGACLIWNNYNQRTHAY